jgi:hypothetical protein
MGADDAICEHAPDGVHDLQLDDLVITGVRGGMAQVRTCTLCGEQAYEASAVDRERPAL